MYQKCNRLKASPAKGLCVFMEEMERDFVTKTKQIICSDKNSIMLWGTIQSNERKLLVKCPNKLNAVGYLEILKNHEEKLLCISWTLFLIKIMLLCINEYYRQLFARKRVEGTGMTNIQ